MLANIFTASILCNQTNKTHVFHNLNCRKKDPPMKVSLFHPQKQQRKLSRLWKN
uniref:Uncharacterized protein n=1 Tax=Romanomermis culicivorax TaxID=13658 RepID=A0A915JQL3_ROMCU